MVLDLRLMNEVANFLPPGKPYILTNIHFNSTILWRLQSLYR
jgi:hypothetical protein